MTPQPGEPINSGNQGLVTEAIRFFGSFSRHIQALAGLAGSETKEALGLYVRLAVMLVGALVFALFAYIFFLLTVAFGIALLFKISWVWIALGLTLLHALVAFVCANHVKTHFRTPIFTTTSAELRKDFAALGKNESQPPIAIP